MKKIRTAALILSLLICVSALLCACGSKKAPDEPEIPEVVTNSESKAITQLGSGKKSFLFVSVKDDVRDEFVINTDEETVGDALEKIGMIKGTEGQYGLYVTIVNGYKAEYETDKKYWAFYVDGALAEKGVDQIEIEEGKEYMFKMENA